MSDSRVLPLRIAVGDEQLEDLDRRLLATRWPDVRGLRSSGVPAFRLRGLVHHWVHHYDWRSREVLLNSLGWYCTDIDGASLEFLHVRSSRQDAIPILLVHGWPGSVLEFRRVLSALAEPGGRGEHPAFHIVVPCLPGASVSGAMGTGGWDLHRIAAAWAELMMRLGYSRWVAHGGGSGTRLAAQLGLVQPLGLVAVHLATYDVPSAAISPAMSAEPCDVALTDSPAGLAGWVLAAVAAWTEADADEFLDTMMLHWLAGTSPAGRDWWPVIEEQVQGELTVPVGCSHFGRAGPAGEIWRGLTARDLVISHQVGLLAQLPALQQPDVLVTELQRCYSAHPWATS